MENTHQFNRLETHLGYTFYPFPDFSHPGAQSLSVVINKELTLKHYDPEKVRASIFTEKHLLATIVIGHPWPGENQYRFGPGLIRINDRQDEIVDAFGLGGDLAVNTSQDRTEVRFTSSAPIFPKINFDDPSALIANEIECVIATQRARWLGKLSEFEQKLWSIPPDILYHLCINYLKNKHHCDARSGQISIELNRFIRSEFNRLHKALEFEETIENFL